MNISSPCVNICRLDSQDVCIGCLRTREEIARWIQMTDEEKSHVIAGLKDRQRIPDPTVHPAVAGLSPEDPPSLRSYGETGGRGSVQGLFFDSHGRDARATTAE